jgi:WD40 repeat protein
MIQGYRQFFMVLLTIIMISTVDVQAQSVPSSPASGASIASSENNGIKILGIDSIAFPKIKVNFFTDKLCAMSGNLKKEDFKVKEDDNDVAIDNVYFTGNASGQKLDLAIVFDETTSMDEEIYALKSKVKDLTQKINSSKRDARYSLVTFNGADVATKINWTNDADSFRAVIGKLSTSGGNTELPENSLDGIERALSFGFRPDAQKVIIVVTDEPSQQKGDGKSNSAYTMDDVKSDLLNSSAMLIAVSPDFRNRNDNPGFPLSNLPKYADMRVLANEASGLWIDINSADFSTILKQIQGILTGIYVIEYTSPDMTPSENRTVFVSVDAPGCLKGSASGFYTTPGSAPESQGALSISGRIFDDSNGDGVKGTDEAGLEGWDVLLERPDGNSATVKTDRKGYYIFTGLQPGSYGLGTEAQGNWTATAPAEGIQAVELVDAHESEIDFGFRLPLANQPPLITVLMAEPESPQEVGAAITWTVDASDPDGDQILYRFFLSDEPMTDWMPENSWTWTPIDVGSYEVEVRVRDGKHAGSNGMDDQRISEVFEIIKPSPSETTPIALKTELELKAEFGKFFNYSDIAFSPDGRTLASLDDHHNVKLWDVASGTEIRTLEGYPNQALCFAFSPDGRTLASAWDDKITTWDVASGTEIRTLTSTHCNGRIVDVAFTPDGQTLASACNRDQIMLWDVVSGTEIRTLEDNYQLKLGSEYSFLFCLAFSPDGRTLASGGQFEDKTIKMWDVASGNLLMTLKSEDNIVTRDIVFSPDGRTLASVDFNPHGITLWDVASGKKMRTLGHGSQSLAFSPDGRILATSDFFTSDRFTQKVTLWDVANGTEIQHTGGKHSFITSVAFSPDGSTLASANVDYISLEGSIRLWRVA